MCWGNVSLYSSDCPGICGTPLLFLSSQACTPLLDSVRASLVEEMSWDLRLRFIHLLCKWSSSHFWLWSWRVGLVIKSTHCSYIPCVRICNSSSRGSSAGICSCAYTKTRHIYIQIIKINLFIFVLKSFYLLFKRKVLKNISCLK